MKSIIKPLTIIIASMLLCLNSNAVNDNNVNVSAFYKNGQAYKYVDLKDVDSMRFIQDTVPYATSISFQEMYYKVDMKTKAYFQTTLFVYPTVIKDLGLIEYTSSDTTVATIDNNGKLFFLKSGTTDVHATVRNSDGSQVTAVTKLVVTNYFETVEIDTWFGHWPQGGLIPNPDHDPNLTFQEVEDNANNGWADPNKTYTQYADSIGWSYLMLLCNGTTCDNYGNLIFENSVPIFRIYVSYLYRSPNSEHNGLYLMLNSESDPYGYTVDPTWTNDAHPNATPGKIRIGTFNEADARDLYLNNIGSWRNLLGGSYMEHRLPYNYWRTVNSAIITEANINFCWGNDGAYLGQCRVKVKNPVIEYNETGDDITISYDTYEYDMDAPSGWVQMAPPKKAPKNQIEKSKMIMRQSRINESLNLAPISKMAVRMPELLK